LLQVRKSKPSRWGRAALRECDGVEKTKLGERVDEEEKSLQRSDQKWDASNESLSRNQHDLD